MPKYHPVKINDLQHFKVYVTDKKNCCENPASQLCPGRGKGRLKKKKKSEGIGEMYPVGDKGRQENGERTFRSPTSIMFSSPSGPLHMQFLLSRKLLTLALAPGFYPESHLHDHTYLAFNVGLLLPSCFQQLVGWERPKVDFVLCIPIASPRFNDLIAPPNIRHPQEYSLLFSPCAFSTSYTAQ